MLRKTKPLIVVVYCGKAWVLNRMANLIKETLSKDFDVLTCYSGALTKKYNGDPQYIKNLPIDAYCNLVPSDDIADEYRNGNEIVVSTVHHWVNDEMYNQLYPMFAKSNFIVVDSSEWKYKLQDKGFAFDDDGGGGIDVIPPFVDERFFKKTHTAKSHKITLGIFAMIHSNPEEDRKGSKHLLPLAEYIKASGMEDKFKFVISGGGWDLIIAKIRKIGVEVDYFPEVADSEMPKLYSKLDFYLMLSDVEGGPFSVMEAMAKKVVVIATNIGVVRDIGKDKENILIVDNKNSKQIFDLMLYYHNNKDEYKRLAGSGFKVASSHTADKVYAKYIDIFNRLIDKSRVKYDSEIDLEATQRYLDTFGRPIIQGFTIAITPFWKKHILKPMMKFLRVFVFVPSLRKKMKATYGNWR